MHYTFTAVLNPQWQCILIYHLMCLVLTLKVLNF